MKKVLSYLLVSFLAIILGINVVEAKEVELDVNSEQVQDLYNLVGIFHDLIMSGDFQGLLYKKDYTLSADLSDDVKMLMASYKLLKIYSNDMMNGKKITKEEMLVIMKSIFGDDVKYSDGIYSFVCYTPKNYTNGVYEFYLSCGGIQGPVPYFEGKLLKAMKTDSTIEIYESVIWADEPVAVVSDYGLEAYYNLYTPNKEKLIATQVKDDFVEYYVNEGYVYKYTFNLNNTTNEYYFSKVEKVDYDSEITTNDNQEPNVDNNYSKSGIIFEISLFIVAVAVIIAIKIK